MDIGLCHAAHHLPLSFHEAWDSSGSMNMGTIQTSHNPPPTARKQDPTASAGHQSQQLEGAASQHEGGDWSSPSHERIALSSGLSSMPLMVATAKVTLHNCS